MNPGQFGYLGPKKFKVSENMKNPKHKNTQKSKQIPENIQISKKN